MDEYVGKDIGIYHVESVCNRKDKDGHKLYHVKCRYCGYEYDMRLFNIKQPTVCRHKDRTGRQVNFKPFWENERLKHIFTGMKRRCFNPNDKSYRWYGSKGISICSEWLDNPKSFEEWALNNGFEEGLTIDRIDENKDYSPDNCRWISLDENVKYKSTTSIININGEEHTGKDWSKILGLGINRINTYVRKYGLDNTIEFIKRYMANPNLKSFISGNQNIYNLYMS